MHVLVQPVHPVLVLQVRAHSTVGPGLSQSTPSRVRAICRGLAAPGARTCGKPVRMLARLGEQLLTEVKAFWKTKPRRASASRFGVRMAELL